MTSRKKIESSVIVQKHVCVTVLVTVKVAVSVHSFWVLHTCTHFYCSWSRHRVCHPSRLRRSPLRGRWVRSRRSSQKIRGIPIPPVSCDKQIVIVLIDQYHRFSAAAGPLVPGKQVYRIAKCLALGKGRKRKQGDRQCYEYSFTCSFNHYRYHVVLVKVLLVHRSSHFFGGKRKHYKIRDRIGTTFILSPQERIIILVLHVVGCQQKKAGTTAGITV